VGIALGPFPGGVLFKFEVVALTKKRFPASEAERTGDAKLEIVLAIGLYGGTGTKRRRPGEPEQPDPDEFKTGFKFEWEVFVGIGFTYEHAPVSSFGLGIIVMASGSAQYLIVGRKFAEVGLNFEGQATISFEGDKKYILCKGSIAVEITIAFVINIEWESPDQEVLKEEI
jgi:hypothetical protein